MSDQRLRLHPHLPRTQGLSFLYKPSTLLNLRTCGCNSQRNVQISNLTSLKQERLKIFPLLITFAVAVLKLEHLGFLNLDFYVFG